MPRLPLWLAPAPRYETGSFVDKDLCVSAPTLQLIISNPVLYIGHRWMDNDCVQRVTDSFSELAQIKVTAAHTERLPGAPSGLVLDPFNEEETVRLMDKDQVVPNDPIISNKWRWRYVLMLPFYWTELFDRNTVESQIHLIKYCIGKRSLMKSTHSGSFLRTPKTFVIG